MDLFSPTTSDDVVDLVQGAVAGKTALEIIGGGSKRGWGHAVTANAQVSTAALTGITLYEPEELVISMRAGTSMAELEAALSENGQHLAFEPPDLGPLYGQVAAAGTIGGAIASNLSGPRRVSAGAARDHILGFKAVNGRGESFKSGGRVVKNVTGFDLPKLMTGSFGTLAILNDITLKVLPAPPVTKTLVLLDQTPHEAVISMAKAHQLPFAPSASVFLPTSLSTQDARSMTAIRFEGREGSLKHRVEETRKALAQTWQTTILETTILETQESVALWHHIGSGAPFVGREHQVWQISVPPTALAKVSEQILQQVEGQAYFEGSGLIWLSLAPSDDAHAELVRQASKASGGSAMLLRADEAVRAHVPVFEPLPGPLKSVTEQLRASFDPLAILNPGRMGPPKVSEGDRA